MWRGREGLEFADFWGGQGTQGCEQWGNVGFMISRHEDVYDQR